MGFFLPSSRHNYISETILVLLLICIGIVENDDIVNAQDSDVEQEMVLSANPQFFTPSEQDIWDDTPPEALAVVGLLFNLRSKVENETIYITGFEFLTSESGPVYYELGTREGEYYDEDIGADGGEGIGAWESFDLISYGIAESSGECAQQFLEDNEEGLDPAEMAKGLNLPCPLTVANFTIPFDITSGASVLAYPWTVEPEATRSIYITLASQHLLVSPSTTSANFDKGVMSSTADLDLFGGVATRTYPLHPEEGDYYFDSPMGFIGKVHYYVAEPREETPAPTPPPTAMETEVISSASSVVPTSVVPTPFGATKAPTQTLPSNATESSMFPTYSPTPSPTTKTAKPTRRCRPNRPCLPLPATPEPTTSPLVSSPVPMTMELMVYVENVPGRVMEEREQEEYVDTMTDFLQGDYTDLKQYGVTTTDVEIFHHYIYEEDKRRPGGRGNGGRGKAGTNKGNKNATEGFTYNYNTNSGYRPETHPTVVIMTEVSVQTRLPYDTATFFLWDELSDHEQDLIDLFSTQALFVSYFRDITNITFEVVEDMSKPPTGSPTMQSDLASSEGMQDEESQGDDKRNVYVIVGIALGVLWCILTLCGFRQIFKHRSNAKEQSKMRRERLTRRQSSTGRSMGKMSRSERFSIDWTGRMRKKKRRTRETAHGNSILQAAAELDGALDSSEDSSTAEETARNSKKHKSKVTFA